MNKFPDMASRTQDINWAYIKRPGRPLKVLCTFTPCPGRGINFNENEIKTAAGLLFPDSTLQFFERIYNNYGNVFFDQENIFHLIPVFCDVILRLLFMLKLIFVEKTCVDFGKDRDVY